MKDKFQQILNILDSIQPTEIEESNIKENDFDDFYLKAQYFKALCFKVQ